ncbi:LAME_0F07976g1_1 [Lachancea meyersii CBS 8951]|uniref:LAME_0F07976g1_1 n=1 Tax=Lachancea meyersii CBS 8951 TaxID=1266667 RepID=A0A1G4JUG1_9SACH|nr:LAME_0F07976g1_1 [Lachancea meyersii CBS 8951]
MSATHFPSLFDMTVLESQQQQQQQPHVAVASEQEMQQPHEPIIGELIFDKFAQSQPRAESFSAARAVKVKTEFESPLLGDTPLTDNDVNSAADDLDHFFASSADSTPLFGLESVQSDPQTWESLFDDDISVSVTDPASVQPSDAVDAVSSEPAVSQTSTAIDQRSFLPTPVIEDAKIPATMKSASSSGMVQKPSSLDRMGFVPYTRKNRVAPLTPIIPESDDPVALKRAKNTEAARRSRARKLQRMSQLEIKVEELLKKNTELEQEVATLRSLLGGQL